MHDLQIAGEHKLRISHCLAALPGQSVNEIKEVMSHPIALMQCEDFLDKMPNVKVVEHEDTALAAKEIKENNLNGTAAICSTLAAEIYGLDVIANAIETNPRNFTRFLVLAKGSMLQEIQKIIVSINLLYSCSRTTRGASRKYCRSSLFTIST